MSCRSFWYKHGCSRSDYAETLGYRPTPDGRLVKSCPVCGKTFEYARYGSHDRIYCSKACKDNGVMRLVASDEADTRTCENCGRKFVRNPLRPNSRFCSSLCRRLYWDHGAVAETAWLTKKGYYKKDGRIWTDCLYCGTQIEAVDRREKFCSLKCITAYRYRLHPPTDESRARRRALYAALPVERKLELLARARLRYAELDPEIRQRRLADKRRRYVGLVQEKTAPERARLERLAAEEEQKLADLRSRFRSVEDVLLLPVDQRWQYSKNWTAEERAYALKLEHGGTSCAFDSFSELDSLDAALDLMSDDFLSGPTDFSE